MLKSKKISMFSIQIGFDRRITKGQYFDSRGSQTAGTSSQFDDSIKIKILPNSRNVTPNAD